MGRPFWVRWDGGSTESTQGAHQNNAIIDNQLDTVGGQDYAQDLTVVDGMVTVVGSSDNLVGLRLAVLHETIVDADINENDPEENDAAMWYSWYFANSPMVFRIRSKRVIPPEHKLWATYWKAQGGDSTTIRIGMRLLVVSNR